MSNWCLFAHNEFYKIIFHRVLNKDRTVRDVLKLLLNMITRVDNTTNLIIENWNDTCV